MDIFKDIFEEDDDSDAYGIPVEVQLVDGGYFEAFLMDILNDEALIHFPCDWMPDGIYQLSQVRFPPAGKTPRCALHENMIAEVLVEKTQGSHKGWFKCRIQMINSDVCQFEYLDMENGPNLGYTRNLRELNVNPPISSNMLQVYKIIIPENFRESTNSKIARRLLEANVKSALVHYDAVCGELAIISRNIADIPNAEVFKQACLRTLNQLTRVLQHSEDLFQKLEMAKNGGFTAKVRVPRRYLDFALGQGKSHLHAAKNIDGIIAIQLIRKSGKFIIHGETEEAVKEACKLLEIKKELHPVTKRQMIQIIDGDEANMLEIVHKTGVIKITYRNINDLLEKGEEEHHPFYITGTAQAIENAKLSIDFYIDHLNEIQRLLETQPEDEHNSLIAIYHGFQNCTIMDE